MTGKEKVARRVVDVAQLEYVRAGADKYFNGDYLCYESPNWILDDIDGTKGATAERRLRELREEYAKHVNYIWEDGTVCRYKRDPYGYRPSRDHENYWEYEREFIEFLKDYVEQRGKK